MACVSRAEAGSACTVEQGRALVLVPLAVARAA
jgi:hypothetical protein